MKNVHLRGLDEPLLFQLKQMASFQHTSVNTLFTQMKDTLFRKGELQLF